MGLEWIGNAENSTRRKDGRSRQMRILNPYKTGKRKYKQQCTVVLLQERLLPSKSFKLPGTDSLVESQASQAKE